MALLPHDLFATSFEVLSIADFGSEEPVDSRRHIHMSEGEKHGPIRHTILPSPPTNPHAYVTNPHGDLVKTSRELE